MAGEPGSELVLYKWITVAKLKELLNQCEDDWVVMPNQVFNLLLVNPVGPWPVVGIINVLGEEFERWV